MHAFFTGTFVFFFLCLDLLSRVGLISSSVLIYCLFFSPGHSSSSACFPFIISAIIHSLILCFVLHCYVSQRGVSCYAPPPSIYCCLFHFSLFSSPSCSRVRLCVPRRGGGGKVETPGSCVSSGNIVAHLVAIVASPYIVLSSASSAARPLTERPPLRA